MTLAPSVLFRHPEDRAAAAAAWAPDCLRDLNLDQVFAAIAADRPDHDLLPFLHFPLREEDDVAWRQEVLRDLEDDALLRDVRVFGAAMSGVRADLARAGKIRNPRQAERWFLQAAATYVEAAARLNGALSAAAPPSRGLRDVAAHLAALVASPGFGALRDEAAAATAALSEIRYGIRIDGLRVDVAPHGGEADFGAEVEETFNAFRQGAGKQFGFPFPEQEELNRVEEMILEEVVALWPAPFAALSAFRARHPDFLDAGVTAFDREIQVYLGWLDHIAPLRALGLAFCYPRVSRSSKETLARAGFDVALASAMARDRRVPVVNDIALAGPERVIVVSGPNQGGKTTFSRWFGQMHYLAALGLTVPGEEARLFLPDRIFTHFERGEAVVAERGRLQDDLLRVHDILAAATPDSVIVMNEIFSSTSWRDATLLSRRLAERIVALGLLCIWVTFVEDLATLGPQTVSMVSTLDPADPAARSFRVVRQVPDGRAYALAIAEKHRLTRAAILERLAP